MYGAYEPLAQDVHYNADSILSLLGQFASAEGSPGKMLFTAVPEALPGSEDVYNFGTRMRDGGARLPILSKGKDRKRIKMPGLAIHHSIYDGRGLSSGEVEGDQFKSREVNLRCKVPDGRQDLLLRVQEGQRGKFTRLEHASRPHGSFEPVDESEWRLFWDPLATRAIEEWAAMFLINAARLSFGTDKLFKPNF